MSDLKTAAQQALEALKVAVDHYHTYHGHPGTKFQQAIDDLRAALAQQAEPDLSRCPQCNGPADNGFDRSFPPSPYLCKKCMAEPVEPHRWEGDNNIESPFNACMHKTYCMTLKQAEPLNLSDPAVQKRLATQWGYVPAAQAEPVEPVAWAAVTENGKLYKAASTRESAERKAEQQEAKFGDTWRPLHVVPLYTAPPQRKPLPKHDQHCVDVPGYGLMAVRLVRAVERAHGIKE